MPRMSRLQLAAAVLALFFLSESGIAQIIVRGQAAGHLFKSASTQSPRSVNDGRPSFGWEADLFAAGFVNDNVSALGTLRVSDNGYFYIDYLSIRIADLVPSSLNFQIGKFDLPFGNLGERRYPRRNFLFGLPLIYEYRTALPDHIVSESALAAGRGQGSGMRLLNMGMYDVGAMVFGSVGMFDYSFAITNGTVSATSYGVQNSNSDMGKIIRLAITPIIGLTAGAAYSWGSYLEEPDQAPPREVNVNTYQQKTAELDLTFSRGYFVFNGQAVYNTWPVPLETRDENLNVFGYYFEGKYTLAPRVYVAIRYSGLGFGEVLLEGVSQPWDYRVTEWEFGAGYFLDRDVLCKVVRRETRTQGGTNPKDNLTVLQLAVAF